MSTKLFNYYNYLNAGVEPLQFHKYKAGFDGPHVFLLFFQ